MVKCSETAEYLEEIALREGNHTHMVEETDWWVAKMYSLI